MMAALTAVSGETAGGMFRTATLRILWVVCFVAPSVGMGGLGMAVKLKDFHNPIPQSRCHRDLFIRVESVRHKASLK
jgi:hypothetical protein